MNAFLACSLRQFPIKCPVSLQVVYSSFWGLLFRRYQPIVQMVAHLPRKGCDPGLVLELDTLGFLATCRALVNAVCKEVGLRYSRIWEFSATASSNFIQSSFIWEAWALIFPSFLICFGQGLDTTGSPSDSVSIEVAVTALTDAFAATHCRVPKTLDNSLRNSVKDIFGICFRSVLAMDALFLSKS